MTTLEDTFNNYDGNSILVSNDKQGPNKIAKYTILNYDSDFYKYESYNRKIRRNIIDNLQVKHHNKLEKLVQFVMMKLILVKMHF